MKKKEKPQSAKESALKDIKEELHQEHKSFIAFRQENNKPIRKIVNEYIKEQKHIPQNKGQ